MKINKPEFIFGLAAIFWGMILLYSIITDTKSYKEYGTFVKVIGVIIILFIIGFALVIFS